MIFTRVLLFKHPYTSGGPTRADHVTWRFLRAAVTTATITATLTDTATATSTETVVETTAVVATTETVVATTTEDARHHDGTGRKR